MILRELHQVAVRRARINSKAESAWFLWWYRAEFYAVLARSRAAARAREEA